MQTFSFLANQSVKGNLAVKTYSTLMSDPPKVILAEASCSETRTILVTWKTFPLAGVRVHAPTTAKVEPVVTEPLRTTSPFGLGTTSPCM